MSDQRQESKVYLSERWTKVAAILPDYFGSGSAHPNLVVDPSGFRRVVTEALKTCEEFLEMLNKVEESVEQRVPGISSFHSLSKYNSAADSAAGGWSMVSVSGTIDINATTNRSQKTSTTAAAPKPSSHIIKRLGDTWLYGGRELQPDEVISMTKGLAILRKCDSLRATTLECIATFGALDAVLEVGRVYGTKTNVVYFEHGDRHLSERVENTELIPLETYWQTLSQVHRIRSTMNKLQPLLKEKELAAVPSPTIVGSVVKDPLVVIVSGTTNA